MASIRKSLLQFTFSGANMRRWNDKLRPVELYELDKQAHKMIVAWLLIELNAKNFTPEEKLDLSQKVIERGIFDYLQRLITTDIKPPIYYKIKEKKDQHEELNAWLRKQLEPILRPLNEDFWQRFIYYNKNLEHNEIADKILSTSHYFASSWEFRLIKPLNIFDEEREDIDASFTSNINKFPEIIGVEALNGQNPNAIKRFANLCGQLRFQIRWSSTPRNPSTSVLGHMFLVACFAYYFSLVSGACVARATNNFFSGLFHDLPELLTRDIISPVKYSVAELSDLIKQHEETELEKRIFEPLREGGYHDIVQRLSYYLGLETGSEFYESIIKDGQIFKINGFDELQDKYNFNEFDPKDGTALKVCDKLTAFMEAYMSISNGTHSGDLYEAMSRIKNDLRDTKVGEISLGTILADFE